MLITNKTKYLVIPTSKSAEKSKIYLRSGGKLLSDLDAKVDFANPESVFYYDISRFEGMDVEVTHESGKSFGFSELPAEPTSDPFRPELHFTAKKGWINDPNGLCFYEGKYHLFFQHNPVGLLWGNMHWGHAVGTDLIHWTELGDVLFPDETGDMFSGSAIVDTDNLLGLKVNEHDPLILFYTAAGGNRELSADSKFTQCIAYSTDGGYTFRKYEKNPVVGHIKGGNRDPKVIRDPGSGVYVMALYLDGDEYALLTSSNLSDWKILQTLSLQGDNECPDFFPLEEDGKLKWVLCGAHDCAMIGDFDPERGFVNTGDVRKFGFGKPYAAQSFNLGESLRRVRVAWNRFTGIPSRNFNCELGLPCEVTLSGGKLRVSPVKELDSCFSKVQTYENLPSHGVKFTLTLPCDIEIAVSKSEEPVSVVLCQNELKLDAAGILTVNGKETMPLRMDDGKVAFRVIADRYGLEVFDLSGVSYGAFEAVPSGDTLTFGGEGSLDRLIVREVK